MIWVLLSIFVGLVTMIATITVLIIANRSKAQKAEKGGGDNKKSPPSDTKKGWFAGGITAILTLAMFIMSGMWIWSYSRSSEPAKLEVEQYFTYYEGGVRQDPVFVTFTPNTIEFYLSPPGGVRTRVRGVRVGDMIRGTWERVRGDQESGSFEVRASHDPRADFQAWKSEGMSGHYSESVPELPLVTFRLEP